MAKKKTQPQPLSKAQRCYIEQNADKLTPEEIATDVQAPLSQVQEALDALKAAAAAAAKKPDPKLAKFNMGNGVVAMTGDQSMDDDASAGMSPFVKGKEQPVNKEFFEAHRNNIHKIRPNDPIK